MLHLFYSSLALSNKEEVGEKGVVGAYGGA
jgi:hypothetical protein